MELQAYVRRILLLLFLTRILAACSSSEKNFDEIRFVDPFLTAIREGHCDTIRCYMPNDSLAFREIRYVRSKNALIEFYFGKQSSVNQYDESDFLTVQDQTWDVVEGYCISYERVSRKLIMQQWNHLSGKWDWQSSVPDCGERIGSVFLFLDGARVSMSVDSARMTTEYFDYTSDGLLTKRSSFLIGKGSKHLDRQWLFGYDSLNKLSYIQTENGVYSVLERLRFSNGVLKSIEIGNKTAVCDCSNR